MNGRLAVGVMAMAALLVPAAPSWAHGGHSKHAHRHVHKHPGHPYVVHKHYYRPAPRHYVVRERWYPAPVYVAPVPVYAAPLVYPAYPVHAAPGVHIVLPELYIRFP